MKIYLILLSTLLLSCAAAAQTTIYVDPSLAHSPAATGTLSDPYGDISLAVEDVFLAGGGEVLILGGTYELTSQVAISTAATEQAPVVIKPVSGSMVKFNFGIRSAFYFEPTSSYITLQGVEIDGNTDETDFWCIVAQDLWSEDGNPDGGGLAVILDGQHITIRDNFIHDCYQKGVEIRDGRYVVVAGNIIQSIANTSLSGGHGIMRQQVGREYFDDDLAGVYRWDIRENLIFNVEQRIYSWVPRKGFMEMVIDEGKSILIDDPKDTDGNQEQMSARIINNVIAFGAVDHIRLKSTPNLEVSNNSIYSEGTKADGISDKGGDTPTPQFTNFICRNNAAQTVAAVSAIEIDQAVQETTDAGGLPVVANNYAMDGKIKPPGQSGLIRLTSGQLFVNPNGGNFSINPALNLPAGVGVDPAVLANLAQKSTDFNVSIGWDGWLTDNLKLSQTILDNIPGVNDGIPGNETVFTDAGIISADHTHIDFDVVDGSWKVARNAPDTMRFELNPAYEAWYSSVATTHLNASGAEYERIRWGDSEVKQTQVFDPNWLTVAQVTAASNTLINGYDNFFTLDGDLLVDFAGVTPAIGDSYDIIIAGNITSANTETLFNRVLFEGFTPENYALEIVNVADKQVVRLTILAPVLPVDLLSFQGTILSKAKHLLTWKTTRETDNSFFEVQRTATGQIWEVIGKVSGSGDAQELNSYAFTDSSPLTGINLYRLRQVDRDGSFSFSPVLELMSAETSSANPPYPNPFTSHLTLPISHPGKQFTLFSFDGRDLTNEVSLRFTHGRIELEGKNLPAGEYLIKYGDQVTTVVKK